MKGRQIKMGWTKKKAHTHTNQRSATLTFVDREMLLVPREQLLPH